MEELKAEPVIETQADMNQESAVNLFKINRRKQRFVKKLVNLLSKKGLSELIRYYDISWQKWDIYVQADLAILEQQYMGGSILPLLRNCREIELTKIQIKELQKAIKDISKI